MRQNIREIEHNNAYRWFIGYDIDEATSHFSTFAKNYSRRFARTDILEMIFTRIWKEKDDDDATPLTKTITESVTEMHSKS